MFAIQHSGAPPAGGEAARRPSLAAPLPTEPRRWTAVGLTAFFCALTVILGALSEGGMQADDITHHQMARFAWRDPRYLIDNWGRPGFTLLHFPLAWTGMIGSRVTSALLSAACALLAYGAARRMGIGRAYLVPLLLYSQPLFTQLAYTSLTETALAFYYALALWLWVRGRPIWSAAVMSLAMITRHEACLWVAAWGVALVAEWVRSSRAEIGKQHRAVVTSVCSHAQHPVPRIPWRWLAALAALAWAPALHNLIYYRITGLVPILDLLRPSGKMDYGSGSWFYYLARWPYVSGLGVVPLGVAGLFLLSRRRKSGDSIGSAVASEEVASGQWSVVSSDRRWSPVTGHWPQATVLIVVPVVVYFLAQTAIFARGAYQSGGYGRFLVPLSPALAIAACAMMDRLMAGLSRAGLVLVGLGLAGFGALVAVAARYELTHPTYYESDALCAALKDTPRLGQAVAAGGLLVAAMALLTVCHAARTARLGAVLLVAGSVLQTAGQAKPYRLGPVEQGLKEAVRFVAHRYGTRRVISQSVWYVYFAGEFEAWDRERPSRRLVERAPVGTLVVWDWQFSQGTGPNAINRSWLATRPWLDEVWGVDGSAQYGYEPLVRIYEKTDGMGEIGGQHAGSAGKGR